MNEDVTKGQGCACRCRGPEGEERTSASETQPRGDAHVSGAALDILDERFARGEIDKAEYEEKKELIERRRR